MNNCLVVAIAAKLKSPQHVTVKVRWAEQRWQVPHVYWFDRRKGKHYHFAAKNQHLPGWRLLWFCGRVERFWWA